MLQRKLTWHKLDNAAKIYPSILSDRVTTLFSLSAGLTKPVNIYCLQKALDNICPRFPYYMVHLRPGVFWYYFEENTEHPMVHPQTRFPCLKQPLKKQGTFPFMVKAYYKTITVEFSHSLTDGNGALIFLNSLLAEYLRLKENIEVTYSAGIFNPEDIPNKKEFEDSFKENYNPNIPPPRPGKKAFHIPGKLIKKKKYYYITGIIKATDVTSLAKQKNVTLTEYLLSVYFESLLKLLKEFPFPKRLKLSRPLRLQVPVNLRPLYKSITMRNFFLTLEPEIDPRLGEYSFDEILLKIHNFMQIEINEKYINQQITRNVRGETHPFTRIFPLPIKNLVLSILYASMGENNTTSGFSNLGRVVIPKEMEEFIERYDFLPPPSQSMKVKATMVGYKGNLHISFGRLIQDADLERLFFTGLRKRGISIKIETNQED